MLSNDNSYRNKPFIVICGCTGTGKTKLSIELAKWLNDIGQKAEIVNADAMQLYRNLNIATNKATEEEMQGIKHHLIGYLEPTNILNTVIDYKKKAVDLIDNLLIENKIPILVGGTHYYIQSVIWDSLIEQNQDDKDKDSNKRKLPINDNKSKVVDLILECVNNNKNEDEINKDLNVRLHDSSLSNEEIYEQLKQVDLQSALRIHPNDRRKMIRALQIYYTHGLTKSELIKAKNNAENDFKVPLRYKNVCLFALNCQSEILNKRLDDRVDQMLSNGLFEEINSFKKEFENKFNGQNFKEYSRNFEFGIFQSIGFKEFDDYFNYIDQNSKNESEEGIIEKEKNDLFQKGINEMKASTRRYAKSQIKWVKNVFSKRTCINSPIVYELDSSDLDKWNEKVLDKSKSIFKDYLDKFEKNNKVALNLRRHEIKDESKEIHVFNKCEVCDRIFVNKFQWECHLNGAKHKKKLENIKRKINQIEKIKS